MRLKHIKGAEEDIKKSRYYVDKVDKQTKLFNNDNPIHLEIGTGKGDFIIEMADFEYYRLLHNS